MLLDAGLADRELAWLATERDRLCALRDAPGSLLPEEYRRAQRPVFRKDEFHQTSATSRLVAERRRSENGCPAFVIFATDRTPIDVRQFPLRHADLVEAIQS